MFYLNTSLSVEWLAAKLGLNFNSQESKVFDSVGPFTEATSNTLTFYGKEIENPVGVTICKRSSAGENILVSDNPRLAFINALNIIEKEIGFRKNLTPPKIHETVVLSENVVIEPGVEIGENSIIGPNVVIRTSTKIGKNCVVEANTTIGSDGFGYERDVDGTPIKFIHLGGVIVGDNVNIGANNTIAKGTLGNTIVSDYVKTDNLVHIAHNCVIGQGALLTAGCIFSGGVNFGKNSWMAPNSTIKQKLSVGSNALVGLGAVVTKNVEDYAIVAGNPARVLSKK